MDKGRADADRSARHQRPASDERSRGNPMAFTNESRARKAWFWAWGGMKSPGHCQGKPTVQVFKSAREFRGVGGRVVPYPSPTY